MENLGFILSQIFGAIALLLISISYFVNKKSFLVLHTIANVFYGAAFVASLSLVAGINTFVSTIRTLVILHFEKKEQVTPLYYFFIFSAIYLTIGAVFYNNYWDILTMITPIMFTFAMFIRKMILVKFAMVLPNALICTYCFCNKFYTSAMLDFLEFTVSIVAIITYFINEGIKKKKALKNSENANEENIKNNKIENNSDNNQNIDINMNNVDVNNTETKINNEEIKLTNANIKNNT